jgi:hypothetical protein
MSDDERDSVSPFLEALDKAHQAQTRFDTARQLAAEGESANVRAERVRFQQLVIAVWKRLRPYLRNELEKWWTEAVIWESDDGNEAIVGLKQLHHYQGATRQTQAFGADDELRTSNEAVLLPPTAVRNALDLLTECAFHLGFTPDADTGRPASNVSVSEDDEQDPAHILKDEQKASNATGD